MLFDSQVWQNGEIVHTYTATDIKVIWLNWQSYEGATLMVNPHGVDFDYLHIINRSFNEYGLACYVRDRWQCLKGLSDYSIPPPQDEFHSCYMEDVINTHGDEEDPEPEFLDLQSIWKTWVECQYFHLMGGGEYSDTEMAARYFLYTRNGDGMGFWDGEYPDDNEAKILDAISKVFPPAYIAVDEDGIVNYTAM